jgi:serine/threonine protein kinase
MNSLIGQTIAHYHIVEQLGEGGMAIVYKAFDTHLERDVAVKVIRTDQFAPAILEKILKRFEREAKLLAKLSHPNIVGVIDYGEYENIPYLVMEYLPGGTLKECLGKPIPADETARLLLPIARALDSAHRQGMIHRDVKPSNILITNDGEPMLTDFGIAKLLDAEEDQTLTGTGVGIGTPEYMAPEQWMGQATAKSDQYSLGVIFYEMVTGHKPYTADTPAAILLKQTNDPLPSPKIFVTEISKEAENVIYKAMARNPQDRFVDMSKFGEGLQTLALIKVDAGNIESTEIQYSFTDSKTIVETANDTLVERITSPVGSAESPKFPSSSSRQYENQINGGVENSTIVEDPPLLSSTTTSEKQKSIFSSGKFWLSCVLFIFPWIAHGLMRGVTINNMNSGLWPIQTINWVYYIFLAICGLGMGFSFRVRWPIKWPLVLSLIAGLPILNFIYSKILIGFQILNPNLVGTRWFFVVMDSFIALLCGLLISFICILHFKRKWLLIFLIPVEWVVAVLIYYTLFERISSSTSMYFVVTGTLSGFFTLFTLYQSTQQKFVNDPFSEAPEDFAIQNKLQN